LLDWSAEADDGTVEHPFSERPLGYVVYTADGRMITTISRRDRTPIGGDLLSAPAEARAAAFESFMAYSGTFRVEAGDVIHTVEMSMYPDWIGSEQRRHVELGASAARLTLSTDALPAGGRTMRHRLDWERVTD
jgi:hypothetical protein